MFVSYSKDKKSAKKIKNENFDYEFLSSYFKVGSKANKKQNIKY